MASITPLDTRWTGRPRSIAACLLESDGHLVLLDPGPASTLPTLRRLLHDRGLSLQQLTAVLLTHIHLDHAGATGSIVREHPGLPVYVHKLGAPHMADPSKLLTSAARLYAEKMEQLFGEFLAVPAANLRILEGGETLSFGSRKLEVLYTPGHASHHVSYFDSLEGVAFVGDTGGIRIENSSFLLPATPPPDIHRELWKSSLDAIRERKPARLFLTHFGYVEDPAEHIARYRQELGRWFDLAEKLLRQSGGEAASRAFVETVAGEIHGALSAPEAEHYIFNGGLVLSWMGLARYWRKRAEAAGHH